MLYFALGQDNVAVEARTGCDSDMAVRFRSWVQARIKIDFPWYEPEGELLGAVNGALCAACNEPFV